VSRGVLAGSAGRRSARVPLVGLVLLTAGTACTSGRPTVPVAHSVAGTGIPGTQGLPSPAGPGIPPPRPEPPPRVPAAPPYTAVAPSGTAGLLAGWGPPAARTAYLVRMWFSGVAIGRHGDELVVVYPSVTASSDRVRTVAHVAFAVFWCTRRAAPYPANFAGCTHRQIEYGDLAAPAVSVRWLGATEVSVAGRFPTYRYPGWVDRDPKLRPQWTGRSYLVRFDAVLVGGIPAGSVTLGAGSAVVTAVSDGGYPNRIVTVRKGPS
jgi:hypothetical protein